MEIQFITDSRGKKKAAVLPFDEWERTGKAKEIPEHVYLSWTHKKSQCQQTFSKS
ncbi:MAG: hypothetical protein V2B19_10985 [Pseudomonadota bacterium]